NSAIAGADRDHKNVIPGAGIIEDALVDPACARILQRERAATERGHFAPVTQLERSSLGRTFDRHSRFVIEPQQNRSALRIHLSIRPARHGHGARTFRSLQFLWEDAAVLARRRIEYHEV